MKTFLTFAIYMVLSACGVTLYPQEFIEDSQASDTLAVIVDPALTPDEIYNDSVVMISPARESTTFLHEDHTHDFHWEQFAIPAGIATASALFVKTPKLVQAREWMQHQLANKTGQPRTKSMTTYSMPRWWLPTLYISAESRVNITCSTAPSYWL